jgi:hypothetical protein
VYAPDGKETEGSDVLLSMMDRAVITGYQALTVIGNPSAKASDSGNPPRSRNQADRVLDKWVKEADCVFEVIPSLEPRTRNQACHLS